MLELKNIQKEYDGKPLLRGISFCVKQAETVCLLGPSGGGKTTLLHIIAGLEPQDGGRVFWGGEDLTEVPVHRRNFGLMFQEYALFPHRTVAENIAFGLRMQGRKKDETNTRVQELLDKVDLAPFANRRVTDLSGGEQQRVALARVLAPGPRLLMLDEPLGALDRTLSDQIAGELRSILRNSGIPTIYVTHDQEEAFSISDRLILLNEGRIVQRGSPDDVHAHPVSPWVANFLGLGNLIPGEVISRLPFRVRTPIGDFDGLPPEDKTGLKIGRKVTLLFRPDGVSLTPMAGSQNHLCGVVEDSFFCGDGYGVNLHCGNDFHFQLNVKQAIPFGQKVKLYISPQSIQSF